MVIPTSGVPPDSSWGVVLALGLATDKPEPDQLLVYGSSDPQPNPAELLLLEVVAKLFGLNFRFFVYRNGKNMPMEKLPEEVKLPWLFYLEDIIPPGLTLGEMAVAIWKLRDEPAVVAHLPQSTLRATSEPTKKWPKGVPNLTVHDLHELGGYLGGSGIHYVLAEWAKKMPRVLYLCPYQKKGRVYEVYQKFKEEVEVPRPLFVPTPFVHFKPPKNLGLPEWAPTPWYYWRSLPAAYRRRVRKEVERRIKREKRIEIYIP